MKGATSVFGSIHIGTVFGIQLRVHWLFLAMALFFLGLSMHPETGLNPFETGLMLVLLSTIVLLHELGHALVARHFRIRVVDITLWPLGGMARMAEIPENTRIEVLIAAAGPAVNFALALLTVPLIYASGAVDEAITADRMVASPAMMFFFANILLGAFNLIPAFPMDGGRILRAFLARKGDWVRATENAVRVGRVFAVFMILIGLFGPFQGTALLPLIGVFIWFAGARELFAVRARHGESPLAQAMRIAQAMARGGAAAAAGFPAAPRGDGEQVGPPAEDPASPAASPAQPDPETGARRPIVEGRPHGGTGERLSDADIERLERFRGRLRGEE